MVFSNRTLIRPLFPILVLFVAFSGWFSSASPAFACSCIAGRTSSELYDDAVAVFSGKVQSISGGEWEQKMVTFGVEKTWKGGLGEQTAVRTGMGVGDCGFPFEEGKSYLVYAYLDGGQLSTGVCNGTALVEESQEAINDLDREDLVPEPVPVPATNQFGITHLVVTALIAFALGLATTAVCSSTCRTKK